MNSTQELVGIEPLSSVPVPTRAVRFAHVIELSDHVDAVVNTAGPLPVASAPTHSRNVALWIDPVSPLTGNRIYVSTSGSVPASTRKVVDVPTFADGVASET